MTPTSAGTAPASTTAAVAFDRSEPSGKRRRTAASAVRISGPQPVLASVLGMQLAIRNLAMRLRWKSLRNVCCTKVEAKLAAGMHGSVECRSVSTNWWEDDVRAEDA